MVAPRPDVSGCVPPGSVVRRNVSGERSPGSAPRLDVTDHEWIRRSPGVGYKER